MALVEEFDSSHEGSDESTESDFLDRSLSVWRGWKVENEPDFKPVALDLHTAASIGQYDCVWTIIQRAEEDLNRQNIGGWTPLMYASYIGHDTIVNLLLDAQCNVNSKNKKGQTPLMLAASCGNESVAYLLIKAGADLESRDKKGWTALFHATYSGHQNMVKFLLDHKANTEVKEPARDFTPFMEAAVEGHEIIVQYFLQHGVDIDARSASGDTARSLALDKGHTKIWSLIDNHLLGNAFPRRADPDLENEYSSSDESFESPTRRPIRHKPRVTKIGQGPVELERLMKEKQMKSNDEKQKGREDILSSRESGLHKQDSIEFDRRSQGSDRGSNKSPDVIGQGRQGRSRYFPADDNSSSRHSPRGRLSPACPGLRDSPRGKLSPAHSPSLIQQSRDKLSPAHSPSLGQSARERVSPVHSPGVLEHVPSSQTTSAKQLSGFGKSASQHDATNRAKTRPPPGFEHMNAAAALTQKQNEHSTTSPSASGASNTAFANAYQNVGLSGFGQLPQLGNLTPNSSMNSSMISQLTKPAQINPLNNNNTIDQKTAKQDPTQSTPCSNTNFETSKPPEETGPPRPKDLESLLEELNLSKYMSVFEEQDVDLTVFLTLTDSDLKEVGIKLFGPRRKMTNAIARWHERGKVDSGGGVEQAYANMLESRVHELSGKLQKALEDTSCAENALEQEKQVRGVLEGAYMEGRVAFQHVQQLAAENRQRCASVAQSLISVNQYQAELARRFGAESQFSRSTGHGQLADHFNDTMRLSKDEQDMYPHIQRMPTQQLIRKVQAWTEELVVHISIITKNTERLLRGGIQAAQQYQRVHPLPDHGHS